MTQAMWSHGKVQWRVEDDNYRDSTEETMLEKGVESPRWSKGNYPGNIKIMST